jgi:hypothetical protein
MRKSQNNYLNRAIAVLKYFENHVSAWINVKIVASQREKVNQIVKAIDAAAISKPMQSCRAYLMQIPKDNS